MANPKHASITVSMPRELLAAFRHAVFIERGPTPALRNGESGPADVLREFIERFVRERTSNHDRAEVESVAEAPAP